MFTWGWAARTICDGLCMLEPLVVFPSACNDSSGICQHIGKTLCSVMCDDHILIALMDKHLGTFPAVLFIECIPRGYIGWMEISFVHCTPSCSGFFFGCHVQV
jgi:hypothetical protein